MSEPRVPGPVESIIRAVAGGATEEDRDQRASTFARGLAIGALVGAAIAGSTIWQRRQAQAQILRLRPGEHPAGVPAGPEPETTGTTTTGPIEGADR